MQLVSHWREWFATNRKAWDEYREKLKRELPKPAFGKAD